MPSRSFSTAYLAQAAELAGIEIDEQQSEQRHHHQDPLGDVAGPAGDEIPQQQGD